MHIYALLIVKKLVITMEKNALVQLALAFFIALIFISSYISLTNYNTQQTTTTIVPSTYFAQGFAEAKIAGYGTTMYFNLTCKNAKTMGMASNDLSENLTILEDNNSIFNFYASGRSFSVEPGNMSAYQIYSFVNRTLNSTISNCITDSAVTIIGLPSLINMTVGTQILNVIVPQNESNASIVLPLTYTVGTHIKVKVSTLVTSNATIYGPINIVLLK